MTYTVNDPRTLFDVVLARLETTGLLVGDAVKPDGVATLPDGLPASPYLVLYPLPDGDTSGSLADPDGDVWWLWQVTCVGGSRQQAQWAQTRTREVMVGWSPTVIGLGCGRVELDDGSGVARDDDVQPPVYYATDSFRLFTSPE